MCEGYQSVKLTERIVRQRLYNSCRNRPTKEAKTQIENKINEIISEMLNLVNNPENYLRFANYEITDESLRIKIPDIIKIIDSEVEFIREYAELIGVSLETERKITQLYKSLSANLLDKHD